MKNKKALEDIYDYCRWNDNENIKNVFKKSSELIDILDDRGVFLRLAISYSNIEILNTLLEYYEKTQLQGDSNSLEYKVAKHKLQTVLQDAINSFDVSKEMQAVLDKYLPKEEDSDQELDDLEDIQLPYFSNNLASAELTEDNLKRLDEHHNQNLELAGKDHQILDTY